MTILFLRYYPNCTKKKIKRNEKENGLMGKKITREMINDYLQKGCHIHIREDDGKGNNRIVETILVIEIPYHQVCDDIQAMLGTSRMEEAEPGNVVVASRTFLSPKDRPNRRISNEVIVGRIIRKIEEGRGLSFKKGIDLCGDTSVFQGWLTMGLPPRKQDVKKIAVFRYQGPEIIKEAEKEVKIYQRCMEYQRTE